LPQIVLTRRLASTADRRKAHEFIDRLKAERWEQDKLGAKPRYRWEDAVLKFIDETAHKRSHDRDKAKCFAGSIPCWSASVSTRSTAP
jgi:hypothetical protein